MKRGPRSPRFRLAGGMTPTVSAILYLLPDRQFAVAVLTLSCLACDDRPAARPEGPPPSTIAAVAAELVEMGLEDQRHRDVERIMAMPTDERRAAMAEADSADRRHAARLREIVDEHGWPDARRFGDEAARAAFLIVQHADHDRELQRATLPLLERAARAGRIDAAEFAYVFDRVRVSEGKPQRYGTQYDVVTNERGAAVADAEGRLQYLAPIVEDPARLDERRAEVGLGSWADYERRMAASQERAPLDAPRTPDREAVRP